MKAITFKTFALTAILFTLFSCSTEPLANEVSTEKAVTNFNYSQMEERLVIVINDYRISKGLNPLSLVNHISYKSEEHNKYMINNKTVSHDFFESRVNNIKSVLGAVRVGENVAYNFSSPESVLNAWLNSPGHKANIEGDYTHFGLSIAIDQSTGKKYYTNIFMKK